jgi:hypothetical protein
MEISWRVACAGERDIRTTLRTEATGLMNVTVGISREHGLYYCRRTYFCYRALVEPAIA